MLICPMLCQLAYFFWWSLYLLACSCFCCSISTLHLKPCWLALVPRCYSMFTSTKSCICVWVYLLTSFIKVDTCTSLSQSFLACLLELCFSIVYHIQNTINGWTRGLTMQLMVVSVNWILLSCWLSPQVVAFCCILLYNYIWLCNSRLVLRQLGLFLVNNYLQSPHQSLNVLESGFKRGCRSHAVWAVKTHIWR